MAEFDIDVNDRVQGLALEALGAFVAELLDRFEIRGNPKAVSLADRVAFFYAAESVQLLADACLLLRPGDDVFAHARVVSDVLRTLVDVFGRQLSVWKSSDSSERTRELIMDSVARERRALDSASAAGVNVLDLDASLQEIESRLGAAGRRLSVTSILQSEGEHELLSVFQWESSFVHVGAAAIASGARSVTLASGQTVDVMLWPTSLFRVAQLTWATYGVGVRLLSFIESHAQLLRVGTGELDARFREPIWQQQGVASLTANPSPLRIGNTSSACTRKRTRKLRRLTETSCLAAYWRRTRRAAELR